MRSPDGPERTPIRALRIGPLVAVAALLALALPGTAGSSSDECTQTLSSAGTSTGSSVRDVICGTNGNDTLRGRGGNDELRGFGGSDLLNGGIGNDEFFGATGDDRLQGESGNDRLNGGPSDDVLEGGSGSDVLVGDSGRDEFHADDGDDTLRARDGESDGQLGCGDGTDKVDVDLVDALFLGGPPIPGAFLVHLLLNGCEDVTIGAVNEGPNIVISGRPRRVDRDGRTRIRLRCPASLQQPSRCKGRLKLQLASRRSLGRRAPRTRYSLRPGVARRIPVRLSRRDRRSLRRRGRANGMVTSVETGQHGKKTTVETVRLRARR
jgi:RTX calcium-binding nonapeptide repeat (4 copies)